MTSYELTVWFIENLIKTRNEYGVELYLAWTDDELDEKRLRKSSEAYGLCRGDIDAVGYKRARRLMKMFPGVEWDSELLADALYVNTYSIPEDVFERIEEAGS